MKPLKRRELWDPFQLGEDWSRDLRKLFGGMPVPKIGFRGFHEPDLDIRDEADRLIVTADLPGMKKDEVEISVEGNRLLLKGERKQEEEIKKKNYYCCERFHGSFFRSVELPAEIDAEKVKASYQNGVLEIVLPKKKGALGKGTKIEIEEKK